MRVIFVFLTVSFLGLGSLFASEQGQVDSKDLRKVLQSCRDSQKEVRCLRRGIRKLIKESQIDGGDKVAGLICQSGANGLFAVYNQNADQFLDGYYKKTSSECTRTIRNIYSSLFCSVGQNGEYAVKNIDSGQFLSQNYSIPLDECIQSVRFAKGKYVCIAGGNGQYARYNQETGKYLDAKYAMEIDECLDLLP